MAADVEYRLPTSVSMSASLELARLRTIRTRIFADIANHQATVSHWLVRALEHLADVPAERELLSSAGGTDRSDSAACLRISVAFGLAGVFLMIANPGKTNHCSFWRLLR